MNYKFFTSLDIWIVKSEICGNHAYHFNNVNDNELNLTFSQITNFCLFLPVTQSSLSTLSSNLPFSVYDQNLQFSNLSFQYQSQHPFFISFQPFHNQNLLTLKIKSEKFRYSYYPAKFTQFSIFDFKKGLITKDKNLKISFQIQSSNFIFRCVAFIFLILIWLFAYQMCCLSFMSCGPVFCPCLAYIPIPPFLDHFLMKIAHYFTKSHPKDEYLPLLQTKE